MARKMTIAYMDENLMRSAKILAAKRNGKIYEVFEDALRRYLEKADWPGTSCEEPRDYGAHEWVPRQRIPFLFGGQDPTLGERFEEELYPS